MNSILLSLLLALAVGESQTFKVDDRTEAKVTVQQESVKIDWTCKEDNMTHIKKHYKNARLRWNLFAGETVDLWFSPHARKNDKNVLPPNYRIITNPSAVFFNAFLGTPRPNRNFKNVVVLNDDNWTAEWIIPYAALGTGNFRKPEAKNIYSPAKFWSFQFNRRSESGGKKTYTKSPVFVVEIPQEVIAPYQQIMLLHFTAKNGEKAGQCAVDFTLKNNVNTAFEGKYKLVLLEGNEETLLKEEAVSLAAKTDKKINVTATLPEKAVKFAVKVYVYDKAGLLVRVSRDLAIENPWVQF